MRSFLHAPDFCKARTHRSSTRGLVRELTLACVMLAMHPAALASPERVDQLIQTAQSLDSDPRRGAVTFEA
ncbi:MAG: hypothetical protein ACREMY_10605, partial [bacterium]